jgi:aspartate-semialdehyde dehydrogenase
MAWSHVLPERPVVAVAGATGAVGREMLAVLEQRAFPAERVIALASHRSAGNRIPFAGDELVVEEMTPASFEGVDLALFSAGASVSREMREAVTAAGCVMIDNSSAFRMDDDVPLVVPEVNAGDLVWHSGVVANPNCSTIQMVIVLNALRALAPLKRVVVSTYQAASGAGQAAMDELYGQTGDFLAGRATTPSAFVHRIAFNCIPQIDVFMDDGSTKEEWKMVVETRKILGDASLGVAVTCVRVPVLRCHSEALAIEFDSPVSVAVAREVLAAAAGVTVLDDPRERLYPMPALLEGTDDCYVGRIRRDESVEHGLQLWIVADQLRKGAALNTVQIAEALCAG